MDEKGMNRIIARVILALNDEGIKLQSPYDLEQIGELLGEHSRTVLFFYENEQVVDPVSKAKEAVRRKP